jgi:hypothetical protein
MRCVNLGLPDKAFTFNNGLALFNVISEVCCASCLLRTQGPLGIKA